MKKSIPSIMFGSFLILVTIFTFAMSAKAEPIQAIDDTQATTASLSTSVETSKRPPVYFTTLLTGGVFHEDWDNRLTSHESTGLFTPGLALRLGGVIKNDHHMGVRFQGSWRSTQSVLDSMGGDNEWGAVSSYFLGPEYRYVSNTGVYFGVSAGIAFTLADNHVDSGGSPECDSDWCVEEYLRNSEDHGAFGLGMFGTVGYEYRVTRKFAINVEAFMGFLAGEDENYQEMVNATYGLAFGVGI